MRPCSAHTCSVSIHQSIKVAKLRATPCCPSSKEKAKHERYQAQEKAIKQSSKQATTTNQTQRRLIATTDPRTLNTANSLESSMRITSRNIRDSRRSITSPNRTHSSALTLLLIGVSIAIAIVVVVVMAVAIPTAGFLHHLATRILGCWRKLITSGRGGQQESSHTVKPL
ncbi:hypothetical protein HDK64DRAFT_110947 [Phyllosticta capitalensis]